MNTNRNRSWVWKFYYQPNPETPRVGVCKACNTIYSNGSVERMQKHLRKCKDLPVEDRLAIEAYFYSTSTPSPSKVKRQRREPALSTPISAEASSSTPCIPEGDKANLDLVQMILSGQFPLSMIHNEYFISFLHRLNPDYKLPSRNYLLLNCLLDPGTRGNKLTALERNEALKLIRQQLAIDPRFGHAITTEAREWLAYKGDYAVDMEGPRSEAWEELKQEDCMDVPTWWNVFFHDKKLGNLVLLLNANLIKFNDSGHVAEQAGPATRNEDPATSNESTAEPQEQPQIQLNVPQNLQQTYQNSMNGYSDGVADHYPLT
uniref:BED-type domain-containing protein n=1 Tax=Panagrellus redivivus TaxID=6233 RepID=A0A7E4UVN2_PANRE